MICFYKLNLRRKSKYTGLVLIFLCIEVKLSLGNSTKPSAFEEYGTLHTMQILSHASQVEENLKSVLRDRVISLKFEKHCLAKYLSSRLMASKSEPTKLTFNQPKEARLNHPDKASRDGAYWHRMSQRYVSTINPIRNALTSIYYQESRVEYRRSLQIMNESSPTNEFVVRWPDQQDGFMSHLGITTIMEIYQLPAHIIRNGQRVDTKYGGFLVPYHYEKLAIFTLARKFFYMALEWAELILNEENTEDSNYKMCIDIDLLFHLAVQSHNRKYELAYNSMKSLHASMNLFTEPYRKESQSVYINTVRKTLVYQNGSRFGNGSNFHLNEIALCSREMLHRDDKQTPEMQSPMSCYLERKMHPYLILNPVKAEMLSEYPLVIQFYEVLGHSLLQELYETRGALRMSTVTGGGNKNGIDFYSRTSGGTGVSKEFQAKISSKSQMVTGLYSASHLFDRIQNAEYVYGRLFRSHIDPLETPSVGDTGQYALFGDRLATVLYYADTSDNMQGGLTPFCEAGIAVYPTRGSAVFWLNMFRNGTVRKDISHAACPVKHGFKIILNHWIPYNPNFQTFKCSLNQFD